jgi:hypothetical protein
MRTTKRLCEAHTQGDAPCLCVCTRGSVQGRQTKGLACDAEGVLTTDCVCAWYRWP